MGFIFYDTETTGLNRAFDQIVQFAAVATNDALEPIPGRSMDLRCRRLPHVVPAPKALLLSRVSPSRLESASHSHLEMTEEIARQLDQWEPAIFAGYNIMAFDEPLLRQAFYQNLYYPYRTTTLPNRRADIIRMLIAVFIWRRDAISFAERADGRPLFQLGPTIRANGIAFDPEAAHDALYDVQGTIALAKVIRRAAPDLWDRMIRNGRRVEVQDLLKRHKVLCGGDVVFGRPIQFVASPVTFNPKDTDQVALFDLSCAPEEYLEMPPENLARLIRRGPAPLARVRINRQPILAPYDPSFDVARNEAVSADQAQERAEAIASHEGFTSRVAKAMAELTPPHAPGGEPEEEIHDGAPVAADQKLMTAFHKADWKERAKLARRFQDPRLRELAERLVFEHAPELLPDTRIDDRQRMLIMRRATDGDGRWRSLDQAFEELAKIRDEGSATAPQLEALTHYLFGLRMGLRGYAPSSALSR
ncbi:MAG: exonuclease domain-containing protein [Alphaproteobacteria bacterium]|nr:exonuclease domain-containing protein [Alphaproteobacteria bacterium]